MSRVCGTMPLHFHQAANSEEYVRERRWIEAQRGAMSFAPRTAVIRIPVVVHVVHHIDSENVSDSQVHSQIEALNRDFMLRNDDRANAPAPFQGLIANPNVEFVLAVRDPFGRATTGITRTRTSVAQFPRTRLPGEWLTTSINRELKSAALGHVAWPRDQYLNMWVCNMGREPLGYATFPGMPVRDDGVVIDHTCFGTNGTARAPFDLGRTATHEVGHWLDLLHIWGDDEDQENRCGVSDNVADTPNQAIANGNKPTFPHITCNNGPHGDLFINYMDYVDDDVMVMFTTGQVERMEGTLQGPRVAIQSSPALTPPPNNFANPLDGIASLALPAGTTGDPLVFDGVSWVRASKGMTEL